MEFKLPDVGEGVTEGELIQWLVKPGDKIEADQPLAEIMTDKATVEIPSPVSGVVKETKANAGDIIVVGQVMLVIETGGAIKTTAPTPSKPTASVAYASNGSQKNNAMIEPPVADSSILAAPSTRRLAREMGVDINHIKGTGNLGRVTRDDIVGSKSAGGGSLETVSSAPMTTPPMNIPKPRYDGPSGAVEERIPLRGVRRKIAEKMQQAKHIIPHFTIMDECDVTELVEMRAKMKAKAESMGVKVTYLPFVLKALIATLREFPEVNASIDDAASEIVYKKYYNIGFAADTPQGLMVPVIKNADMKTIFEISKEIIELARKAKDGKLALDDMKGGTISITNIGSIGGTYATPIINHPEVAILGMYSIQDKPALVNGQWINKKVMNLTLTADHRLIDGAVAARFLKAMVSRLENPGVLMLDLM